MASQSGTKVNSRPVITTYYEDTKGKKLIRANNAKWANRAVLNAINHMQLNHYGAAVAEVYDAVSAELHAIIVRRVTQGKIEIVYKREVKEDM